MNFIDIKLAIIFCDDTSCFLMKHCCCGSYLWLLMMFMFGYLIIWSNITDCVFEGLSLKVC